MMVFNDEMGHAFGNSTLVNPFGIGNDLADLRMDLQETFVQNGMPLSDWYVDTFRDVADQINGRPPL